VKLYAYGVISNSVHSRRSQDAAFSDTMSQLFSATHWACTPPLCAWYHSVTGTVAIPRLRVLKERIARYIRRISDGLQSPRA
jgi:hypothetical protein